jgi:hypothetical protein
VSGAALLEFTWFHRVTEPHNGARFRQARAELEAWWRAPCWPSESKRELPVWCAATFRGDTRAKVNVLAVTALVLDFDGVELPMRELVDELPVACAAHTSWSHGEKPGHCYRLLVPVSRPMTADEHGRLWPLLAQACAHMGAAVDVATKDPGRAWFVPCTRPGYASAFELKRDVFDVDEASAFALRARAPSAARTAEAPAWRHETGAANVLERAAKYLARQEPAIAGAGGHNALLRAAIAMVRGFALSHDDALRLLGSEYNPRCVPPWSRAELERKTFEAARAERVGFGYLINERRAAS